MTFLETQIKFDENLAAWLQVDKVALVREDLLPDGGGKKRRALELFVKKLQGIKHIHLLSYSGSHTAYTLSHLLPKVLIHLYGTRYGGGPYEKTMTSLLISRDNIIQEVGSSWSMSVMFNKQKRKALHGHYFMRIGGSLGSDHSTQNAVDDTIKVIGPDYHHVLAVASGDLLMSVAERTNRVTGVLTQPLGIRLVKFIGLKHTSGLWKPGLSERIRTMKEVDEVTGQKWDPIFMGAVFSYLKKRKTLPSKLCIWITCPAGIEW